MKINQHWVAKFGGTSLATHAAMKRCANVISQHSNIKVVVVSAPAGVTNLLVKLSQGKRDDRLAIVADIKNIVNAILQHSKSEIQAVMQLLQDLDHLAEKVVAACSPLLVDELLSYGERLSARLFKGVLIEHGFSAVHVDARTLVKTNNSFGKAEILIPETAKQVADLLLPHCKDHIIVTEGFIGGTVDNLTTTLGRGGSDYSAAILAEAMQADILQIWTDVPGIYTVDPRLVPHARPIEAMCFAEAAELAQFGAKVLHPATLWPAIRKNIPVFVGSSMDSNAQGTWIRAKHDDQINPPLLRAIALRRGQSLLTINSLEMLHTHGFLAKIFSVLSQHKLSVDLVTTSEVSVALTLNHTGGDSSDLLTPDILAELQAIGNVSLTVDKNLSLIALIGNQLHVTSGISGRVFNRLSDFNIRLICHGASPHNLCFLVDESDAAAVIQAIHEEFFEVGE